MVYVLEYKDKFIAGFYEKPKANLPSGFKMKELPLEFPIYVMETPDYEEKFHYHDDLWTLLSKFGHNENITIYCIEKMWRPNKEFEDEMGSLTHIHLNEKME